MSLLGVLHFGDVRNLDPDNHTEALKEGDVEPLGRFRRWSPPKQGGVAQTLGGER